jgi:sigma-B regulation protein RsbU (phosphoserine phosphatase)
MQTLLSELDRDGWQARDDLTVLTVDGAWVPRAAALPDAALEETVEPETEQRMEELFELAIRSRPDRLKLARAGVEAAAKACGFAGAAVSDIVLAVDEACANIIVHGYRGLDDGGIRMTVSRLDNGIRILIADEAPTVSPSDIRPRDLEAVAPGGLGTHLIRSLMDEVRYLAPPEGDGNVLELIKRTTRSP